MQYDLSYLFFSHHLLPFWLISNVYFGDWKQKGAWFYMDIFSWHFTGYLQVSKWNRINLPALFTHYNHYHIPIFMYTAGLPSLEGLNQMVEKIHSALGLSTGQYFPIMHSNDVSHCSSKPDLLKGRSNQTSYPVFKNGLVKGTLTMKAILGEIISREKPIWYPVKSVQVSSIRFCPGLPRGLQITNPKESLFLVGRKTWNMQDVCISNS